MIVADWLHRQARLGPGALALLTPGGRHVHFAELDARVEVLSRRLRAAGVVPGARVLALLPNGSALVELVHAAARSGAALAPLDPRATADEALRAAALTRPAVVVGARTAGEAAAASARAHGARLWLGDPDGTPLDDVPVPHAGASSAPVVDLAAPLTIVFTSGTTGTPTGVALSAGNHLASARASAARSGAAADDRWLACLPLHHVGGLALVLRAAIAGGAVVLQRGFSPEAVLRALRDDGVTQLSLVPTALHRLLAVPDARPHALRVLLLGGARADRSLVGAARARGFPVAPTYGLTETCSQVATARPFETARAAGFVGAPLDGTEVRVVGGDGCPLASGATGEIAVRGPTVALGRLDEAGRVRPLPCDAGGWLRTADRGSLDEHGCLTVLGRADDVIVTGGENVTPEEVEAVLLEHPDVADAGVAGVPDAEWGHVVCAWIVPRGARAPDLAELRAACSDRLARPKLPRRMVVAGALPRTASGKLRRGVLVASLAAASRLT